MTVHHQLVGELIEGIFAVETLEQQYAIFNNIVQRLGFESSAYTFIPNVVLETDLDYPPVFIKSDAFSDSFIEQYVADRFDEHDFTIRAAKDDKLFPMDWQESIQSDYLTEPEKNVLVLAKEEHGIQHGITVPVMNEAAGIAGFSITNTLPDRNFDLLKQENIATLRLCTKAFNDIVFARPYRYHEFIPHSLRNLREKELIVLEFVLQGRSMAELGRSREPISKKYGENLLLELKKKFGGVSTHELIRHVVQLQII
ncbi:hypothetical protein EOL70_05160 [Leucothrix sargassi]|nr:hypothetical protein EOL70_05160 [Leucothrix sargassi]